jgi:hypothetical protein
MRAFAPALLAVVVAACVDTSASTVGRSSGALATNDFEGIGRSCASDAECTAGLECSSAMGTAWASDAGADGLEYHPECAWRAPAEGCPEGWMTTVSYTVTVGTEVGIEADGGSNATYTGTWCRPLCFAASDCPGSQCCLAARAPDPGSCTTFNPHSSYPLGIDCR